MLGIQTALVLSFAPLFGGGWLEQTPGQEEPARLEIRKAPPLVGSQALLALPIQNSEKKTFGRVEDLVIHPRGDVAFLIGSYAGWVDMDEELFVLPWSVVQTDLERKVLTVNLDEDGIKDMRRYKQGETPRLDEMEWWEDTDEHYADLKKSQATPIEAAISLAPTKLLYLLSTKKGEVVFDPANQKIGEIRELAIDPRVGRVSFIVVSAGGYIASGDKLVAVPWDALRQEPDPDNPKLVRAILSTNREQLAKAPEFKAASEKSQLEDAEWILSVYQFYSVAPYWVGAVAKESDEKDGK